MPAQPKLQRWTDLLAALLRRHFPAGFDELRNEVAAYASHAGRPGSLMRMFERDKDELRALGVPLESVADADGALSRYRLVSRNFYLPFLQLALESRRPPRRPKGPGYQSLPVLAFEPDELAVIVRAARRVAGLGDAGLAHEAGTALRKLAHDLPVDGVPAAGELIARDAAPDGSVMDALSDALRRRKSLVFTYRSMHRDETSVRTADPWGLAFLSGHWYLVARDHDANALRNFRVSRISDPVANAARAQSADYAIPPGFDLAQHARSRQAWELGDAEQRAVTVRFRVQNGATLAAMELGEAVAEDDTLRRFTVRRNDTFARWVLSFAGDASVEAPPDLAAEVRAVAAATLARYEGGA